MSGAKEPCYSPSPSADEPQGGGPSRATEDVHSGLNSGSLQGGGSGGPFSLSYSVEFHVRRGVVMEALLSIGFSIFYII